jgi:hypothetical protein
VHRHEGEPCPRCGTTLERVFFEDYVIAYCPACQTEGRVLKDRASALRFRSMDMDAHVDKCLRPDSA